MHFVLVVRSKCGVGAEQDDHCCHKFGVVMVLLALPRHCDKLRRSIVPSDRNQPSSASGEDDDILMQVLQFCGFGKASR